MIPAVSSWRWWRDLIAIVCPYQQKPKRKEYFNVKNTIHFVTRLRRSGREDLLRCKLACIWNEPEPASAATTCMDTRTQWSSASWKDEMDAIKRVHKRFGQQEKTRKQMYKYGIRQPALGTCNSGRSSFLAARLQFNGMPLLRGFSGELKSRMHGRETGEDVKRFALKYINVTAYHHRQSANLNL